VFLRSETKSHKGLVQAYRRSKDIAVIESVLMMERRCFAAIHEQVGRDSPLQHA